MARAMRSTLLLLAVIVVAVLLALVYFALDPASSELFPKCAFLELTGYKCPGCGSQRAMHALLNGDVGTAFRYNAMLFISVPWLALCIYAESQRVRNPRLYLRLNSQLLIWLFLAMVLLWWLLRNIFNW